MGGVNNYAETTHRRNQDTRAATHQEFDVETFAEKEDRKKEVEEAEKTMKK